MLDLDDARLWIETAIECGADRILVAFDDFDDESPEYPIYLAPGELLERAEQEHDLSDSDEGARSMQVELGVFDLQDGGYETLVTPERPRLAEIADEIGELLKQARREG